MTSGVLRQLEPKLNSVTFKARLYVLLVKVRVLITVGLIKTTV